MIARKSDPVNKITIEGLDGIFLSSTLSDLKGRAWRQINDLGGLLQFVDEDMLVGFDTNRGLVVYINAFGGYQGALPDGVVLGDPISKAENRGWIFDANPLLGPFWINEKFPNIAIQNEDGDFARSPGVGTVSCISIANPDFI